MNKEVVEQLPGSREEARQRGMARYFTGEPCKHGHVAPRGTASGSCTTCMSLAKNKWQERQPKERFAAYTASYRERQKNNVPVVRQERTSRQEVEEFIRTKFNGRVALGDGPVNYTDRLQLVCAVHGPFTGWLINLKKHGACAQCANDAQRLTQDEFIAKATAVHGATYDYSQATYRTAAAKINVICRKHGVFTQTPNKHLSGQGCPECGQIDPKWERELQEFLVGLGLDVKRNVAVLGKKHVDLYVPSRKFGVELHGLHWHTDNKHKKDYHREKWEAAEKLGIRLIQVFEDEWKTKKEIIFARLAAMLGHGPRFDARKCSVEILDGAEAREFLNCTHIQGAGIASLYYGLRFEGQVVAVASFGKARAGGMTSISEGDAWEVIRYASTGRVRGGFGRLFKRFLADVKPATVVSYCDLRYGDGKLYEATGFSLDGITPPDYWWVPDGRVERIARYVTQKHKIKSHPILGKFYAPGKTEAQVCAEAGWAKIFGVGHQRWLWRA